MSKNMASDRSQFSVMVVCQTGSTSAQLRQALKALGFPTISAAATHLTALDRTKGRKFTHVIFEAKATDMPSLEFVTQILDYEGECIMIAISEQPRIDDVFGLLRAGARGFLVPPFNTETLESVLQNATNGPPLSDAVLNSPDRNGAFTAVVLNNLYRLSVAMRQAREFQSAKRDVKNYEYQLRESVEMAQLFCEGGEDALREKFMEGCINRAKDAATRLGRLRKKLKKHRADGDEEEQPEEGPNAATV